MTGHLILNLKVIKAFALVQSVRVAGASSLGVSNQTRLHTGADIAGAARCLEVTVLDVICAASAILALFGLLLIIVALVVYEALLFEEILSPGISLLRVLLRLILASSATEGIILNVDLALDCA